MLSLHTVPSRSGKYTYMEGGSICYLYKQYQVVLESIHTWKGVQYVISTHSTKSFWKVYFPERLGTVCRDNILNLLPCVYTFQNDLVLCVELTH